jgi:uncharacterized membrane protein YphA (DoxX/SURF4 family)
MLAGAMYGRLAMTSSPKPIEGGLMIFGSIGFITNWFPRLSAGILSIHLLFNNYYMNAFWKTSEPQLKQRELAQFLKNLSLLGATLFIGILGKVREQNN